MAIAEAIDANKPVTGQPHRWKKGESGNPSGRPAIKREVRELAKAMCPEAMQTLGQIMRDKKQPGSARVAACKEVFDRAMGRAEQHHKVSGRVDFAHLLAEYTEQRKLIEGECEVVEDSEAGANPSGNGAAEVLDGGRVGDN